MKKIILFAGLLFCSLTNAQELVSVQSNGVEIEEGQVFTFTETHTLQEPQEVKIAVTNISESTLNLKLRIESITNNSMGENVQFCFAGNCYFEIEEGSTVPGITSEFPEGYMPLAPGGSNDGNVDHFANGYTGDTPGEPVEYVIALVQYDDEGVQIGEPLRTFSYKYDTNLSIDDFNSLQNIGITVNNTVVRDYLNIDSNISGTINIYSINGKHIKNAQLTTGSQSYDLSSLSSGVYVAKFTTQENKSSTIKILKN